MPKKFKRISVRVPEEDLALIKEAAERRGTSQAVLIREAVHRAALAHGRWNAPFLTRRER